MENELNDFFIHYLKSEFPENKRDYTRIQRVPADELYNWYKKYKVSTKQYTSIQFHLYFTQPNIPVFHNEVDGELVYLFIPHFVEQTYKKQLDGPGEYSFV